MLCSNIKLKNNFSLSLCRFFFHIHTYFSKERQDYNRARSSSTGNGDGAVNNDNKERGYYRGGGSSRRKYSYDDDMSSRRGDWKCTEVNFYTCLYISFFPSFDKFLRYCMGRSWAAIKVVERKDILI